ncbi:MAG: quinolinate synthase NadA [Bacteroidales bacterium]|nr:quinolinate synthase NadA [Bacteroidales bacterium]
MIKDRIKEIGFIDEAINSDIDILAEINRMKKEKNAVILGHYYIESDLQDIADFVGDSLALAQEAAKTDADIIVFLGVHFMAETAKILSPNKKVLLPDLNAGCSLADSAPTDKFADFVNANPDHLVISYVNTTAEIKALTDIICTSSNAVQIVESLPKEQKIIFGPDKNLGNYIESVTGRKMLIWDGACHVHQQFDVNEIVRLKKEHPKAKVLAHPECNATVLVLADYIGATSGILKFSNIDDCDEFIVATESGILHQMKKLSPDKTFIPAPPEKINDISCACNDCIYMKMNTVKKLYNTLKYELPAIELSDDLQKSAYASIKRMLDISEELGL